MLYILVKIKRVKIRILIRFYETEAQNFGE